VKEGAKKGRRKERNLKKKVKDGRKLRKDEEGGEVSKEERKSIKSTM